MYRLKNKVKNVKSKIMINMYKAMVEARLLYGVEVWGCLKTELLIDRMRARVAKVILNVPVYAANDAARGEMGWISGLTAILIRILKYYNYIMGKEEGELVKICLKYYLKENEKNTMTKAVGNEIKEVLTKWGIGRSWDEVMSGEKNIKRTLDKVKRRCQDIKIQENFAKMRNMTTLEYYCKIKRIWIKEDYVDGVDNKGKGGVGLVPFRVVEIPGDEEKFREG